MAAQDAELQLKVSLDLAFFRQQLSGLGQAAAGYNVPINVKFDRRSVQNELNALGRNISQRTYRLEVATNIKEEIKNAGTLAKALRGLDNAVQSNKGIANRAAGGVAGAGVDAGKIQALIGRATKPALQALYNEMSRANIPMAAVGKGTVANLRNAILSGVPQLTTDLARGISNGLNPQMKESGAQGAKLFVDAFKNATGIASPSKVFKALGEFSADGLEIGFLNGLKDFKTKAIGEIKQIVALMKLELASVGDVRMGPGTGAIRTGARGGRQYMNPIGPLPTGSREPWAFSQYRYQPFMAQPGQVRGAGVQPMRARQPFLPAPPVMGTTSSASMLGQARLALPAAGETSARAMRDAALALREIAARQRSDIRSASVMGENRMWSRVAGQVPVGAGGPFLPAASGGGAPPRSPFGALGGMGGMGGFGRAVGNINLPGTGVVREIGNEFAMATKQVLLFGTAYKALAFLTSFPAQVGQAVGALQSFNNTLKAISPTAEEAKTSNQFILDIVNRYNVPLQSARDGFTKLYASMAPAGFKGDEIRELFTGVSQAAATFGMSADKVDRVNYAFAQMASKGQVMSEELKGQLGDVLPGAMGIFTEAAGFEGPDAIQKFSKALEDGAYQGEAMRVLLKNVSVVLTKEFGPGAEGAARTFQGVINRMQNSTKLLYEAFEPVAVGFLNAVVVPLTSGIKTMADGFTAFFKGVKAETSGGFAIAQQLEKLRPAFDGIRANVVNLLPVFQSFGNTLLQVSTILLQIAGNPITGYLAKIYAIALPLNMVLNTMRGLWAANALQLLIFNTRVASGTSTLTAFRGMMAATGASAATTATAIRGAGLTLRTFFATTGIGLVVAGISILIERFMSMNQALEETRNKAVGAAQAIRSMTATEARAEEQRSTRAIKLLETLQTRKRTYEGSTDVPLSESEASLLEGMGIPVGKGLGGGRYLDPTRLEGYKQRVQTTNLAEAQARQRQVQFEEKQAMTPVELAPIEETAKEGKAKKLDTYNRSQLDFIKQNAEQEKLALDRRLQQGIISKTQYELSMAELELATKKLELAEQLRLSGLQINKDNLSAQDKQLKLADAQISYQNELNIAQDKYTVAVEGAKKELEGPLNDALQKTTRAMEEQQMLLDNLRIGLGELTPDQQAYLQTQELIVGKSEDEIEIMKNKLASLRRVFEQQILLNKEVEKERKTRELLQSIEMAGALTPDAELRQKLSQEGYTGADLEVRFGLEKTLERAQTLKEQIQGIASSIGDSFGQAFKGIITGSSSVQEALSGMFRSIADSFADMVSQMIASWLRTQVLQGFQSLFGPVMGALGGSIGGGLSSGFNAGTSSAIDTGTGGWGAAFNTPLKFANGGIASGGFRAFANGGVVSGPTLGLVGEGRYNEAVVPLPDGKSIPVSLGGASGSNISTNIVVNMGNGQGGGGQATGAQGNQLARELEGAVRQVILKESRPGGIIYSR